MGTIQIDGSTPKLTIGNATAEDALILFDGNAQDFHIGLDDTADDLVIGVGSALGTTTALAIDENAGSTFSGTVTVGVDDTGKDVKFFGATSGKYWLWDESADGVVQIGTLTVGVDDAGHDVKLFGATASSYMLWDESADDLNLIASGLGVVSAKDLGAGIHIRIADSGASASSASDALVIENSTHEGISILTSTSTIGEISFGDSGDNDIGRLRYNHSTDAMEMYTSAALGLKIDSAGIITKPLQTYVYAYAAADQTVTADDSVTAIELNTELKDINADFNTTNYTFTAPVAGAYMCTGYVQMIEDTNTGITDWFFGFNASNGAEYGWAGSPLTLETSSGSNYTKVASFAKIVYMDASDTLTLYADCSGGGGSLTFKVDGNTNYYYASAMQIFLLG